MLLGLHTKFAHWLLFDGCLQIFAKEIVLKYLKKYNQNVCINILRKYLEKYYQNAKQILVMIGEGVKGGLIWTGSAQNCTNTNHRTYLFFFTLRKNHQPPPRCWLLTPRNGWSWVITDIIWTVKILTRNKCSFSLLTQCKLIWTQLRLIFYRVDCKHIQLLKSPQSF